MADWESLVWNQLWQVTLLALAVSVIGCLVRNRSPRVMNALWLIVLAKCLLPPVLPHPLRWIDWPVEESKLASLITEPSPQKVPRHHLGGELAEFPSTEVRLPVKDFIAAPSVEVVASSRKWTRERIVTPEPMEPIDASGPAPLVTLDAHRPTYDLRMLLVCLWGAGAMCVWCLLAARYRRFLVRTRSTLETPSPELLEHVDRRARELGLRRAPRVWVTASAGFPCVTGVLRPKLVLPHSLACTDRETLDPIITHELLHLRRGDVLLGVFQCVATGIWWFHPLIWWASRQLSIATELLCDEAAIRASGCRPAAYARRLLFVLSAAGESDGHVSLPHPIAPGMSAFGRTRQRLERIMMTNPKSNSKKQRLATVVIAAAVAVAALPGDFSARAQTISDRRVTPGPAPAPAPAPSPQPARRADFVFPNPVALPAPGTPVLPRPQKQPPKILPKEYELKNVLDKMPGAEEIPLSSRKKQLENRLIAELSRSGNRAEGHRPSMAWSGGTLHVFATERMHDSIAKIVEKLNDWDLSQISIATRFMTTHHDAASHVFGAVGMKWYAVPGGEALDVRGGVQQAMHTNEAPIQNLALAAWRAESSTSHRSVLPLFLAFLDDLEAKATMEMLQEDSRSNIMMAPKVTVFDLGVATIVSSSERPYVTSLISAGASEVRPAIDVIRDGSTLSVFPTVLAHGVLDLQMAWTHSNIVDVGTMDLPTRINTSAVQTPNVREQRIATEFVSRSGEHVLVAWVDPTRPRDPKKRGELNLLLVSPEIVEYAESIPDSEYILPSESEQDAIRSGLVPLTSFPSLQASVPSPAKPQADAPQRIPFPQPHRDRMQAMGVDVTAVGLREFSIRGDDANPEVYLRADPVRLSFTGQVRFLDDQVDMKLEADSATLQIEESGLSVKADELIRLSVAEGSLIANSGMVAVSKEGELVMNLTGDVKFASEDGEVELNADSLFFDDGKLILEGNAMMSMKGESGKQKQLSGSKISMDAEFPAFVVEK